MDGTKMQELRELVEFLKANEIAEFDMEQADLKVRIKFAGAAAAAAPSLDLAQLSRLMSATTATTGSATGGQASAPGAPSAPASQGEAEEKLHEVKSPIVGTFYESPAPGAPSFVQIGDQVEVGQVLCIVEAMKLMNEIEAEADGKIEEILVKNGEHVEYGQHLFRLSRV